MDDLVTRGARDKWEIVDAKIVPFDAEWGVAYTFSNGNGWSYRVGTRAAAERELLAPHSLIAPPRHGSLVPGDERINLDLARVLEDLAASDISVFLANFGGRGFELRIGDDAIVARKRFGNRALDEAAAWLATQARRAFPRSAFARRYPACRSVH